MADVRCVERSEGCIHCDARGTPALFDPDEPPSTVCSPTDPSSCVDFCSRLAPECATPWRRAASCLLSSEEDFRREIFRRDSAHRPEVTVIAKVTDDGGRRVEGAKIRVWSQGVAVVDETSGKDGSAKLKLPAAPTPYTIRVSHTGRAAEIAELRLEKAGTVNRVFHLGPESVLKGRVTDGANAPVSAVVVRAVRALDDVVEVSWGTTGDDGQFVISGLEARRYVLLTSGFGWLPATARATAGPGAPRVALRVARTGVIRGRVVDEDGDGKANAIVVAMLSGGFGAVSSPVIWSTNTAGEFAQDRFQPGTYYLWARAGEVLAYPPAKIELGGAELEVDAELSLSHRGARVRGQVVLSASPRIDRETRAVLVGRSPLAFPRKAVGDVAEDGTFVVAGVLPGRYEITIRLGAKVLPITSGPREIEVPIEQGATVDLPDPLTLRPPPDE